MQYAAEKLESTGIIGLIEPINNYSVPGYYLSSYDKGSHLLIDHTKFLNSLIISNGSFCLFRYASKAIFVIKSKNLTIEKLRNLSKADQILKKSIFEKKNHTIESKPMKEKEHLHIKRLNRF